MGESIAAWGLGAAAASNVLATGLCLWRARQMKRAIASMRTRPLGIGALSLTDGCDVVSTQLVAHPHTHPTEIRDALRFGFAAAQKYLDELGAEYGVRGDG